MGRGCRMYLVPTRLPNLSLNLSSERAPVALRGLHLDGRHAHPARGVVVARVTRKSTSIVFDQSLSSRLE